jgi:hypothetical protein
VDWHGPNAPCRLRYKGIVMSKRMYLLFALFLVSAGFYFTVAQDSAPALVDAHHSQVEALNQLDESVFAGGSELASN